MDCPVMFACTGPLNHVIRRQGPTREMLMVQAKRYRTFAEFYPFYLGEHTNRTSRRLHVLGTSIGGALLVGAVVFGNAWLVLPAFVQGYAFAWIGHFFFERNRPATFQYPLFSFMGDWRLWWETLTGKQPL